MNTSKKNESNAPQKTQSSQPADEKNAQIKEGLTTSQIAEMESTEQSYGGYQGGRGDRRNQGDSD